MTYSLCECGENFAAGNSTETRHAAEHGGARESLLESVVGSAAMTIEECHFRDNILGK
jgi:hypothetical protein